MLMPFWQLSSRETEEGHVRYLRARLRAKLDHCVVKKLKRAKDPGQQTAVDFWAATSYGDLGWKGPEAEVHLVASEADNFFGVIGPDQAQLLALDGATPSPITGPFRAVSMCASFSRMCASFSRATHYPTRCPRKMTGSPTQPQANFQNLNPSNQPLKYPPAAATLARSRPLRRCPRHASTGSCPGDAPNHERLTCDLMQAAGRQAQSFGDAEQALIARP